MKEKEQSTAESILSRKDYLAIAVVIAGGFVAILNQTILSPALPKLMQEFHVTTDLIQWVTTIYMLVNGIMIPVTAYLIDRFSTRKLFITSMVIFMVGTVMAVVAPSYPLLIVARVLQAMGAGIGLPLVAYIPMVMFPKEKRGMAMGIVGVVISCAPAAGPVVAGWVIDSMGWRFVFAGILPLALLITVLSLFLLKNVGEQKNPHLDILSVLLSTLAFGGLLYGFSSASTLGWSHPLLIISVVVGAICFVWFIRRQFHLKEPLLELRIMKIPAFTYSAIINMIINASLIVGTILLPIYLQNVLGYSAFVTGMVTVPSSVLMAIMSPISGMLFDRFGPRGIGILGMSLLTISMIGLALMGLKTTLVYIIAMMICQALGLNLANMPINTWGINALDNDYIAHGNAITNTGRQIAGSLSTGILITVMTMVTMANSAAGQVQATLSGIRVAYALAAVLAAAGLLIVILKVRHTQSIAKEIGMEA